MLHLFTKTQCKMSDAEFAAQGMWIVDFVRQSIAQKSSNSDVRKLIKSGAIKIADVKILDDKARVSFDRAEGAWFVITSD